MGILSTRTHIPTLTASEVMDGHLAAHRARATPVVRLDPYEIGLQATIAAMRDPPTPGTCTGDAEDRHNPDSPHAAADSPSEGDSPSRGGHHSDGGDGGGGGGGAVRKSRSTATVQLPGVAASPSAAVARLQSAGYDAEAVLLAAAGGTPSSDHLNTSPGGARSPSPSPSPGSPASVHRKPHPEMYEEWLIHAIPPRKPLRQSVRRPHTSHGSGGMSRSRVDHAGSSDVLRRPRTAAGSRPRDSAVPPEGLAQRSAFDMNGSLASLRSGSGAVDEQSSVLSALGTNPSRYGRDGLPPPQRPEPMPLIVHSAMGGMHWTSNRSNSPPARFAYPASPVAASRTGVRDGGHQHPQRQHPQAQTQAQAQHSAPGAVDEEEPLRPSTHGEGVAAPVRGTSAARPTHHSVSGYPVPGARRGPTYGGAASAVRRTKPTRSHGGGKPAPDQRAIDEELAQGGAVMGWDAVSTGTPQHASSPSASAAAAAARSASQQRPRSRAPPRQSRARRQHGQPRSRREAVPQGVQGEGRGPPARAGVEADGDTGAPAASSTGTRDHESRVGVADSGDRLAHEVADGDGYTDDSRVPLPQAFPSNMLGRVPGSGLASGVGVAEPAVGEDRELYLKCVAPYTEPIDMAWAHVCVCVCVVCDCVCPGWWWWLVAGTFGSRHRCSSWRLPQRVP